ncbi:MAG: hypothetical protein WD572_00965 [Gammaproteobacteria bacterium]
MQKAGYIVRKHGQDFIKGASVALIITTRANQTGFNGYFKILFGMAGHPSLPNNQ